MSNDINLPEDRKKRFAGDTFSEKYVAPSEEFLAKKRDIRTKATERAVREGYRDNVEKERGTEWYDKALNPGLDHATKGGAYTGGEVRAEMRYGRNGKTVGEMRDYFQGLIDSGEKFNGNARDFLADKHGLIFPDSGGGEETTTPDKPSTPDDSSSDDITNTPTIGGGDGPSVDPQDFLGAFINNSFNAQGGTLTNNGNITSEGDVTLDNSVTNSNTVNRFASDGFRLNLGELKL